MSSKRINERLFETFEVKQQIDLNNEKWFINNGVSKKADKRN